MLGQLIQGILSGAGFTLGKSAAEAVVKKVQDKSNSTTNKEDEDENLIENIEIPPSDK